MIEVPLEVARLRAEAAGPTLILVGGVHGNEPLGLDAARRAIAEVRASGIAIAGEVIVFAGNRPALARGRRYLRRDFNRAWTPDFVATARALAEGDEDLEARALAELADALDAALAAARGPAFAVDLHTTSAAGPPFALVGATEAERAFAARLPLAAVTGLTDTLSGLLVDHLIARGCAALAIEGGQHASDDAAANLHAIALLAMAAAGILEETALPSIGEARARLLRARGDLPPLTQIVHRHHVHDGRDFRMEPGFTNFQRTTRGTLLAREDGAELRAPFDGMLLLPRYQALGADGFFFGREATPRTS